jgi:hypothetical protein
MSFQHLNRRTHLYMGLFLLAWVFIYGITSIPFSHSQLLSQWYDDDVPAWTELSSQSYHRDVPENADMRTIGAAILADAGLEGSFSVWQPRPTVLNVQQFDFWDQVRLIYDLDKHTLRVEKKRFRWDHFLTSLHARGGYHQDVFLADLWAVMVDLVCLAMIIWMISGIILWWRLSGHRIWGWTALGGGFAVFIGFLMGL